MRPVVCLIAVVAVALSTAACGDDDPVTDPTIFPPTPTPTAPFTTPPGVTAPAMPPATTPPPTGAPTESPTATTTPQDPTQASFATCEAERFAIGYPEPWWVNDEHQAPPCSLYHPTRLEVAPENLDAAVFITVDEVPYEEVLEAEQAGQVHNSEELVIDGQRAHVIERTSTGEGLLPEGERAYTYLVDLGDATLVAATYTVGDTDFQQDRAVLDAMIDTLDVEPAG